MQIKRLLFILVSLSFFSSNVIAQEKQIFAIFKGKFNKTSVENVDSIKYVADSLYNVHIQCDSINRENQKLIESLRKKAKQDSLRMVFYANRQKDSLLNVIRAKDKELSSLKANVGFVDTCMVRLANRWLYEKYDQKTVDEAIKYFDRIYSSKLKGEMSIVQELLRSYDQSYREFQSILKEAQDDYDRGNPFACEKYKDNYKRKIENMTYYRRYYKGEWNIRYLNKQIDKALAILNSHKDGKFADFSLLIDLNF